MSEISLRCRCGKVRGVLREVAPETVSHLICYCEDCRAFVHFLERDELLDPHGGAPIVQTAPSRVRITAGQDQLRCMRLSDKGMIRFYTDCCGTPMGNTLSAGVPFVGLPRACLEEGLSELGRPSDEVLGRPTLLNGRSAIGGLPPGAHPTGPPRFLLRIGGLMLRWWIGGKGQPSPYFDPATKQPRVPLKVLTPAERDALRR